MADQGGGHGYHGYHHGKGGGNDGGKHRGDDGGGNSYESGRGKNYDGVYRRRHGQINAPGGPHRESHKDINIPPDLRTIPSQTMPVNGTMQDIRPEQKKALVKLGTDLKNTTPEYPLRKDFRPDNLGVLTNHFAIKIDPNAQLHEYSIHVSPPTTDKALNKQIIQKFVEEDTIFRDHQHSLATDCESTIVAWNDLSLPIVRDGENEIRASPPIKMTVQKKKFEAVFSGESDLNTIGLTENALNIIVSKAISAEAIRLRSNQFFLKSDYSNLGSENGSLCVIRGYLYTVKPGMGQLILNVNNCTSAFFRPNLVSQVLEDGATFRASKGRENVLKGLEVYVTYERKSKSGTDLNAMQYRTGTIRGFGNRVDEQEFVIQSENGTQETTTVKEYIEKTYNVKVGKPWLKAVNVGKRERPCWFAPEHLRILPYQIFARLVPEHLTKDMLHVACQPPRQTRALIERGLSHMGVNPAEGFVSLPNCPVSLDPRMLHIPSGIIPFPRVQYATLQKPIKDAQWNLRDMRFLRNCPVSMRYFVILDRGLSNGTVTRYQAEFQNMIDEYKTGTYTLCGSAKVFPGKGGVVSGLQMAQGQNANFVLLILKEKDVEAYSIFKNQTDRYLGMHSLCITEKPNMKKSKLNNNLKPYFANVMMKSNLKAGGTNHSVEDVSNILKDTLVLGADVTHPSKGALYGTPSIAAVVGSVDELGGKFLGSMRLQAKRDLNPPPKSKNTADDDATGKNDTEIIGDPNLKEMVKDRILDWFEANKRFPKNILYYRDGFSNSQYLAVKKVELPAIGPAFKETALKLGISPTPQFNLTAIIVAKRHHVRFFPLQGDADKTGNCQPGTVVDSTVTDPCYTDFYLQSHRGLKGTAKPTHYFILRNDMNLSEVQIQDFTHKLSYTYVRATMGVSYAPPAYYADRLCERGRCYLRDLLNPDQEDVLELDDLEAKLKSDRRSIRDAQFSPRVKDEKDVVVISKEERELRKAHDDEVDLELRKHTFRKAEAIFNKGGGDGRGNPWKQSLRRTMFWM